MAYDIGIRNSAQINKPLGVSIGIAGGGPANTPPAVEPALSLELSYVSNNLSELQMELEVLQKQLEPVMLPVVPTPASGQTDAPSGSRGIVVDALSAFTARLHAIRAQVSDIRTRLTV